MDSAQVAARVAEVRERIERARVRAGRSDPVTLVAVTKTHPADAVRAVRDAGVADVGENRVQELEEKVGELGGQVNASGEGTKGGFEPEALVEGVGRIVELPGMRVEGLMTMAPFSDDEQVVRAAFRRTRELLGEVARQLPGVAGRQLSMGMSNDFEIAVEEGSTLVRVGSVLFGERG